MRSSRFHFSLAQPKHNQEICRLFQIPFTGDISLAMERQPDYFVGAKVQYERPETYVCHDGLNGRIVGCFSVGKRYVFINRRKTLLRYHSDLRIDRDYQKSSVLFDMCRFLKESVPLLEGFSQTVLFSDNVIINQLVSRKKHQRLTAVVPKYFLHGRYVTHTVAIKKKKLLTHSSYVIRQAEKDDVLTMQNFFDEEAPLKQFYPCYDFSEISSDYYADLIPENYFLAFENQQLVGIVGIWNQQNFKQTRIVNYSSRLKLLKPFLNAYAFVRNKFLLPPVGTRLNSVLLHTILVRKNSPEIFGKLCETIYEYLRRSQFEYMLCGLDTEDGLNKVFDSSYEQRNIWGGHYLVSYERDCLKKLDGGLFYLEAARI